MTDKEFEEIKEALKQTNERMSKIEEELKDKAVKDELKKDSGTTEEKKNFVQRGFEWVKKHPIKTAVGTIVTGALAAGAVYMATRNDDEDDDDEDDDDVE